MCVCVCVCVCVFSCGLLNFKTRSHLLRGASGETGDFETNHESTGDCHHNTEVDIAGNHHHTGRLDVDHQKPGEVVAERPANHRPGAEIVILRLHIGAATRAERGVLTGVPGGVDGLNGSRATRKVAQGGIVLH